MKDVINKFAEKTEDTFDSIKVKFDAHTSKPLKK